MTDGRWSRNDSWPMPWQGEKVERGVTEEKDRHNLLYILLLVQRNCWFANSDVPFHSVTNDLLHGQFAMQTYALYQVDVTSELSNSCSLHMHRVITKQFSLVFYIYINSSGSSCGQIQCYRQSYTLTKGDKGNYVTFWLLCRIFQQCKRPLIPNLHV